MDLDLLAEGIFGEQDAAVWHQLAFVALVWESTAGLQTYPEGKMEAVQEPADVGETLRMRV